MFIKNVGQIIKDQVPLKYRLFEGNSIYGKIISLDEGKGAIKLYDGTIIPAIFVSENEIEKEKFTKFVIENYDGHNITLKATTRDERVLQEGSINTILKSLNIPLKEGTEILMSLIKFNLPVTSENILSIYKNLSFINNLGNMTEENILDFLQNHLGNNISKEGPEFAIAKELFSKLQNINVDFLSFFLENDMPQDINNIIKGQNFLNENFLLNNILDILKQFGGHDFENKSLISFEQIINKIKNSPDSYSKLPIETIKTLIDSIDILKHIYNNYNIYVFNFYENSNLFKNNIVIKNRYKHCNSIDPNDIKVYISIETSKIGFIEGYLHKINKDLFISLSVNEEYITLFKKNLKLLEKSLTEKGYGVISLSLEKLKTPSNLLDLSYFFNDTIFKELDVKV
jgi:hypothetical protein